MPREDQTLKVSVPGRKSCFVSVFEIPNLHTAVMPGSDSLCCSCRYSLPGELCPAVWFPAEGRHGTVGVGPEERHKG